MFELIRAIFRLNLGGYIYIYIYMEGRQWRSLLRYCFTSRKVTGSIPDGIIGIFH